MVAEGPLHLSAALTLVVDALERTPLWMTLSEFPSGRYLVVNDAFARGTGYAKAELIGHTTVELGLVPRDFRAQLDGELRLTGTIRALEFTIRRKDGTTREVRYWADFLQTPEGPRVFALAEDRTEQRALETARDEALKTLEKIAQRVPGVVYQFYKGPDGRSEFPYASPVLKDLLGATPDEVRHDASKAFQRVHPDDLAALVASIEVSERELTPWRHEFRQVVDGTVRWLSGNGAPERQPGGGTLWYGFMSDVTERKRAEEELHASRLLLSKAFGTSPLMMTIASAPEGRFVEVNEQFLRVTGYARDAVLGKTSLELGLMEPADREQLISQLRATGAVRGFDTSMTTRTGERRQVRFWTEMIEGPQGPRLLNVADDVTEQRRLEASLAQSERLANMGMLAAGVAHEINNPLAYVLSNLDLLSQELPQLVALTKRSLDAVRAQGGEAAVAEVLRGPAGEAAPLRLDELLDAAQASREGVQRIRKISRGLGSFGRVERGERERVDVNAALETAATMAHNEVKFRATLVKDLAPVPAVLASEGKLAQVFLNFLINAAHAMPEGHAPDHHITLRSWAEGGWVCAEVSDDGHGIPKEHLERVFEPFFTTKQVGVGSGLGLAISRNIITEFGGEIRLESEVGRGTRVQVRLPAAGEVPAPPPAAPAPSAPRLETGLRARVLVVDDEAPIRRSVQRVLRQHEVLEAASGLEARRLLERDDAFDIILCDLMMPELTGMELHAWLVAERLALAERLVFISGGAFTPLAAEYLQRVTVRRLEKPFDHATLRALIDEYARRRAS